MNLKKKKNCSSDKLYYSLSAFFFHQYNQLSYGLLFSLALAKGKMLLLGRLICLVL